jgi:hypothetical protein
VALQAGHYSRRPGSCHVRVSRCCSDAGQPLAGLAGAVDGGPGGRAIAAKAAGGDALCTKATVVAHSNGGGTSPGSAVPTGRRVAGR